MTDHPAEVVERGMKNVLAAQGFQDAYEYPLTDADRERARVLTRAALDAMGLPSREQVAEAIGKAANPTQVGFGVVSITAATNAILALLPAAPVCSGAQDCTAPRHEHGCFADTGNCEAPDDHAAPVRTVGSVEECQECGSADLTWSFGAALDGRNEHLFALGCNECSATVRTMTPEQAATVLTPATAPSVDELPVAGGCECLCHVMPGMSHMVACCGGLTPATAPTVTAEQVEHVVTYEPWETDRLEGKTARCTCGWSSRWFIRDGSAEADAHGHMMSVSPEYRLATAERNETFWREQYEKLRKRVYEAAPKPKPQKTHEHGCSCHIDPPCDRCTNCRHVDHPECPNDCQTCEDHEADRAAGIEVTR